MRHTVPIAGPQLVTRQSGHGISKPTPFPLSIFDNIAFGIRLYERLGKAEMDQRARDRFTRAALWDEVKDKLQPNGAAFRAVNNSGSALRALWR